ncbi:hypothetical protein [Kocuria rhizosphaericola]|uniref:hypothetical protein n=1 Tax=Kocuria rhizosphaericola TaxID=3376284 RepID=UPI00379F3C41
MSTQDYVQTGKFYTAARKFQQLIGVTPTGEAIPGGPYTVTQFVVGIMVLVTGFITRPIWSQGTIADVLYIAAAAIGITYGVGKLPRSRRSIINLINCCITLMSRPRTGKYRGRAIPSSYSRTTARPANRIPSDDTAVRNAARDDQHAPTVRQTPINCGLDRLTADLTTAR